MLLPSQLIEISKYAAFFHDGSVMDIRHTGKNLEFSMASAEMDKEDVKDNIILSKDDSIQGKLHLEGIKSIVIGGKSFLGRLEKKYDRGTIFDFELTKNSIELSIDWIDFPPKPEVNEFSVIKIEVEKIWWENIPNLENFM